LAQVFLKQLATQVAARACVVCPCVVCSTLSKAS